MVFDKNYLFLGFFFILLELLISIWVEDVRSLFGLEFFGFSIYDFNIIIVGEGINFINFFREFVLLLDEILKERNFIIKV